MSCLVVADLASLLTAEVPLPPHSASEPRHTALVEPALNLVRGGREGERECYEEGKRKKGGWKEERDREGEGGMERENDL